MITFSTSPEHLIVSFVANSNIRIDIGPSATPICENFIENDRFVDKMISLIVVCLHIGFVVHRNILQRISYFLQLFELLIGSHLLEKNNNLC